MHLVTLCRESEESLLPPLRARLASVQTLSIPYRHDRSVIRRARHFLRLGGAILAGVVSRRPTYLLRYRYRAFERLVARVCAEKGPELVQIEYQQLAPLRRQIPADIPVVLDTLEVQSIVALRALQSARRPAWHLHALELASWMEEARRLEGFARVLTVSDADRLALETVAPHLPLQTLPMGVDCQRFRPHDGPKEPDSLVFVGSYDHHQNLDAAAILLDRVLPEVQRRRPGTRLHMVGNHPPAWLQRRASPSVVVPGFVADLPTYVGSRQVFVAPLRQGGGIKIKLLQALALGMPVVTTPAGAEGIGLEHGVDALIAPNVEGCAALSVQALEDPAGAAQLGKAGRRLVEERFDAPMLVERLEAVHAEILRGGGTRAERGRT